MIKEFEFYHGAVIARLIHTSETPISVRRFEDSDNASYVIDEHTGLYIKYSKKRMPPWRFSFSRRHQDQVLQMRNMLGKVFVALVCDDDGIVVLSFDAFKRVLNDIHDEVEWVSVKRNKRQMYGVAGSDGELGFKIARNDFSELLGHTTVTSTDSNGDPAHLSVAVTGGA
jgi:hypothetical protein